MKPRCGDCIYLDGEWCKRFPDVIQKNANDWCGEFKPALTTVDAAIGKAKATVDDAKKRGTYQ